MFARPLRLTALVLALTIPAVLPAQFGGLGKILDRAKAKVDSAKATVDTAQRIADSAKSTANEATHITKSTPHATASHDTTGGKRGTGATSTSSTARSKTATTGAKDASQSAARSTSTTKQQPSGGPLVTESVYAQFTRGFAVEKALRKANPKDGANALNSGVTTSGLSQSDYAALKTKLTVYYGFAIGKQKVDTPLLTAPEVTVLDTHKDDVVQLMGP